MSERLATTKRDGKRYIVQQRDLRTGLVHCWGELVGYRGRERKHDGSVSFDFDSVHVEDVDLSKGLLADLFEQAALSREPELLAGDLVVKEHGGERPGKGFYRSQFRRHPDMRCLCCGQPMRLRRLRTGASFYGCGSWERTGCNARWTPRDGWNLTGTSLEGSDLHGSGKSEEAAA